MHRIEGGSPREDLARIAAMAVVLAVYLARGRVYEASAEPASDPLVLAGNIAFDSAVGAIPLAGDLFDFAFKSNTKNLKIIKAHLDRHHPHTRVIEG